MPLNSYHKINRPKTRSVYRLIVTITFVVVLVSSLLIGSIFYWKVLTPIEAEVFAEANKQMRYNLDMRLESKKIRLFQLRKVLPDKSCWLKDC